MTINANEFLTIAAQFRSLKSKNALAMMGILKGSPLALAVNDAALHTELSMMTMEQREAYQIAV
jgi:hypothetical protein